MHGTDSTKKHTDKSHEGGPQYLKMYLERLILRAEESGELKLLISTTRTCLTNKGRSLPKIAKKVATNYPSMNM